MMMSQLIRMVRIVAIFPLAGLSLFIYKLALQPAIHQFYKLEPDMLMVYGLVLVAAVVHAVLLSSVLLSSLVLKFYKHSLALISSLMGLGVLAYCVQLAWLSPLEHRLFWQLVFSAYALVWAVVLWFGHWLLQREQEFEHMPAQAINSVNTNADSFG